MAINFSHFVLYCNQHQKNPILSSKLWVIQTDVKNISDEQLPWGVSLFDGIDKRYRIMA